MNVSNLSANAPKASIAPGIGSMREKIHGTSLGGEAGLRMGEMMALEWDDVEFSKMQLHVRRSDIGTAM